jgi:succinate dehydrogenase / fumarate reductase iron-sulfur subunit
MSKRMVQFSIYRYDPDKDDAPYMQDISVELEPTDRKLLDALTKLKAKDDAISYRRSCREGVCGSDAMNINGKNGLACLTDIDSLKQPIVLRPLPGLPVIRDLIVDMTQFFKQYHSIKPYLINNDPPERERLQSPDDREELNGLYECILCACCSTSARRSGGTRTSSSVRPACWLHIALSLIPVTRRQMNASIISRIRTVCSVATPS